MRCTNALLLCASLGALGCAQPLTQLILVVDTDIELAQPNPAIPVEDDQLREISLSLFGPCDAEGQNCAPVFQDSAQQYNTPGSAGLPFSIGLLLDNQDYGPYRLAVRARLGGEPAAGEVALDAVAEFVPGESRVVLLHVVEDCIDVTCPTGETCGPSGTCRSERLSQDELPVWTGELGDFALSD